MTPNAMGSYDGGGNITNDPELAEYGGLNGTSPCRDAGTNQPWMDGAKDLDGNPRILPVDGVVDIGCFEYVPEPVGTVAVLCMLWLRRVQHRH